MRGWWGDEPVNPASIVVNRRTKEGTNVRASDFLSPKTALYESITGEEMLTLYKSMHHEAPTNPEMVQWIQSQNWGIKMLKPETFPDHYGEVVPDDPFNRVIHLDDELVKRIQTRLERGEQVDPVIMGPTGSVIDGNHRAQAARAAGVGILAYVPMGETV